MHFLKEAKKITVALELLFLDDGDVRIEYTLSICLQLYYYNFFFVVVKTLAALIVGAAPE